MNYYLNHAVAYLCRSISVICLCLFAHAALAQYDAKRIISAGGSITEIAYALGLGDRIIATDTSSFYPNEVHSLPKVGYFRTLSSEGVLSLKPDLILGAKGIGPQLVLEQISQLGVPIKTYQDNEISLERWEAMVNEMGKDFNRQTEAQELVKRVKKGIAEKLGTFSSNGAPLTAIALISLGQRGPMAAGKNTVPDLLFTLTGVTNAASELEGYKPFSTELLAGSQIDLVLVPSHVVAGLGGEKAICENQIIQAATNNKCNLYVMDGLLLMGLGSRLDLAVEEIVNQINNIKD